MRDVSSPVLITRSAWPLARRRMRRLRHAVASHAGGSGHSARAAIAARGARTRLPRRNAPRAATGRGAAPATAAARRPAATGPGTPTAPTAAPRPAATGRGTRNGADGGTASGGDGSWHGTGANGTTAYGGYDHYYGGTYSTYHPPTVVNHYYGSGCYDCGGWNAAGAAAVGVAARHRPGGGGAARERLRRRQPVCHGSNLSEPAGRMRVSARRSASTTVVEPGSALRTGRTGSTTGWCPRPDAAWCDRAAARAGLMHRSSDVPLHRRDDGAESRRAGERTYFQRSTEHEAEPERDRRRRGSHGIPGRCHAGRRAGRGAAGHRRAGFAQRHDHARREATPAAAAEVRRRDQGKRHGFDSRGGRRASCRPRARPTCCSS